MGRGPSELFEIAVCVSIASGSCENLGAPEQHEESDVEHGIRDVGRTVRASPTLTIWTSGRGHDR
jgi:hypothetical protein